MPSHKIHLAIANEVNKKLKLDNDSIMLGSVLPDLITNKRHDISHYQIEGSYEEELANPDKFVSEYRNKLNSPIMLGYLVHLLTDKYYNDYFFQKHCIFGENGKAHSVILKNRKIRQPIKKYKQTDFAKYDKWLLKHNFVVPFKSNDCIDMIVDLTVAKFDKNCLKCYIEKANNEIIEPNIYKIKSNLFYKVLTKKELDKMYNECVKYILKYIEENNILKGE